MTRLNSHSAHLTLPARSATRFGPRSLHALRYAACASFLPTQSPIIGHCVHTTHVLLHRLVALVPLVAASASAVVTTQSTAYGAAIEVPSLAGTAGCAYPKRQFFSSLDISLVATFGGGVDLWNATAFWVQDAAAAASRLDMMMPVRALSSGPFFQSTTHSRVVRNGTAHDVSVNATACHRDSTLPPLLLLLPFSLLSALCTLCTHLFLLPYRFQAASCVNSRAAPIAATACVGSVARFMPADATDQWCAHMPPEGG